MDILLFTEQPRTTEASGVPAQQVHARGISSRPRPTSCIKRHRRYERVAARTALMEPVLCSFALWARTTEFLTLCWATGPTEAFLDQTTK